MTRIGKKRGGESTSSQFSFGKTFQGAAFIVKSGSQCNRMCSSDTHPADGGKHGGHNLSCGSWEDC